LERRLALNLAPKSKSVLVIGAGPAGMEAAIVAAQRGHEVSLWEKDFQLGGNLIPASVPEFKKDLKDFNRYMSRKINKLRVDLRLGRDATAKMVKEANPDVVIIATGGSFIIPKIPGVNRYNVFTAVDLLLGRKKAGEKVLVLGGGVIGCETGIHLAQKSRKVTIVEALQTVFRGTNKANNQQMLRMIGEHNVEVLLNTNVQEITDRGVLVTHANKEVEMEVDTIVIAVGLCAKANLYNELEGEVAELHAIGDCIKPGMVLEAIWGGHRVAHLI
jgi:2-enoate reductase